MGVADRLSGANRNEKWRLFLDLIGPVEEDRVLDVGYQDQEYSVNDNYIEKHYPWPQRLTALGVEDPGEFVKRHPAVRTVKYDGSIFPFDDNEFDIIWSNAVIEHVGPAKRQVEFLAEIRRTSRRSFFSTPNRFFPFEVHTRIPLLHYLPKPTFDAFLKLIGKSWAAGDYMYLLSLQDFKNRIEAAGIKDYKIVENRLFGFVVDFVAVCSHPD